MTFLRNMQVGVKLPVVMTLLVAVTIVVMAIASALKTRTIILENAAEKLQTVASMKAKRTSVLLHAIDRDLRLRSAEPATTQALIALADGYNSLQNAEDVLQRVYIADNPHEKGQKNLLIKADTGSSYGFIHAVYHPVFDTIQDQMGYYDIFLIDPDGNIVYSVLKENDFATNLTDGPWASSGLAIAFQDALDNSADDGSVFVDFAPYGPSAMAPASFVARPVFNEQNTLLGVLAYQMPIDALNAAARDLEGLGDRADGFIVGADFLMRTDSRLSDENDIIKTRVSENSITNALAGGTGTGSAVSHLGQTVLRAVAPIEFNGTQWVSVVQEDMSVLLATLRQSVLNAALVSAIVFGAALCVSIMFARSISQPVRNLTAVVKDVADGSLDTNVPETERCDEFGDLARATEVFRQNAIRMAHMNKEQEAAQAHMAEMSAEKQAAAEREARLAREKVEADRQAAEDRDEMMHALGASFGQVVDKAVAGDFSARIETDFEDEVLVSLGQNVNLLMETMDHGLSATSIAIENVARGDLTVRMEGDFNGAFADLKTNMNGMLGSLNALIGAISESGTTLAGSSSELRQTADQLSRQAEQNAASVEQTSAALEELGASVKQVNSNIADVSSNAQEARETADSSEEIAARAAEAMDKIADGSKEITRVIAVINEIAFQINLLALNAGVEAARAGEAGRGFSVVASEVRQLSQRASEAAREIGNVIAQSDAAVSEGVTRVASAKASLEDIAQRVVKISDNVDAVNRAVSEQSAGITEITSAVLQIDSNTQKQAAAFEELTAASHVLATEAADLGKSTERFKIDPPTNILTLPPHNAPAPSSRALMEPKLAVAVGDDATSSGWEEF